ncbi:gpW family head-tail joining protein [Mesorhizobium sp. B2-4-7]|uniref:gpW family head-tail joining protein n=1 Tax=Mesorhizobium sp. B2-4-7 TaxID=2589942 RepID=UPI00112C24FF|nr:gpW family head-tail joining protein [Mesorhizobium sp. B2-4-7]TPL30186.1 phage tail protein [Mesorhizobium sp. B2-4-7]
MALTDDERAVLTARLASAEAALHSLMVGKATVSLSYDGESATFSQTDEAKLRRYIADLKSQLGLGCNPYRRGIHA